MKIKHIIEGIETVREFDEGIRSNNPQGIPEGEDLSWDDPDLVQARKFAAAKKKKRAVVKTADEVGSRVADIGPGGREHNVKTDRAWDRKHGVKEAQVDEVAAPGQEEWIKKNKKRFVDQYGKEKGERILYATAWKRAKK
jgi:hypothetical protein